MSDVTLVGLGVVGKAILRLHLSHGFQVRVIDVDADAIDRLSEHSMASNAAGPSNRIRVEQPQSLGSSLHSAIVSLEGSAATKQARSPILIESIAERLDVKRAFFSDCESWLPSDVVLATNTSTLQIESIAESLTDPSRLVGMHFFMPVPDRDGVEVIASKYTTAATVDACLLHAGELGKTPFCVGDQPGFVVNRMLSPYVNEAFSLFCNGATAEQIERAALDLGMPISPLELVDVIGARTAFDGGRVYWQAFPSRMTTSPLLPRMVKSGRLGRHVGKGFYNYDANGDRSQSIAPETAELASRYGRDIRGWSVAEVSSRLMNVLRTEARCILDDGVVLDIQTIITALHGGLGFQVDHWEEE